MCHISASGASTACFRRKPVFVTYTVASADNSRKPPTKATPKPIQFQMNSALESSVAVCRRAPMPMRRKSTRRLLPSHMQRPTKWTHRMTGYIQDDSRIVVPQGVFSNHLQHATMTSYIGGCSKWKKCKKWKSEKVS